MLAVELHTLLTMHSHTLSPLAAGQLHIESMPPWENGVCPLREPAFFRRASRPPR